MQGNPLWSLEVGADFGQLGLEPALLFAIFSQSHDVSPGKFSKIVVRHDVLPGKIQTSNRKT